MWSSPRYRRPQPARSRNSACATWQKSSEDASAGIAGNRWPAKLCRKICAGIDHTKKCGRRVRFFLRKRMNARISRLPNFARACGRVLVGVNPQFGSGAWMWLRKVPHPVLDGQQLEANRPFSAHGGGARLKANDVTGFFGLRRPSKGRQPEEACLIIAACADRIFPFQSKAARRVRPAGRVSCLHSMVRSRAVAPSELGG